MIKKFERYNQKHWLTRIGPSQLSILLSKVTTNNGAESYHARINQTFKCNHPNIWYFCDTLNKIITDTDIDITRLNNGLNISRNQKQNQIVKEELRESSKQNLVNGVYTPIEYINVLQSTLKSMPIQTEDYDGVDSDSGDSDENISQTQDTCCVCLQPRENTVCYRPCSHAKVCLRCDQILMESNRSCPVCRTDIQDRFIIYQ